MKISKFALSGSLLGLAALQSVSVYAQAGRTGSVLTVNDPDPIGAPGDAKMSLDEAIRLANGALAAGSLSASERSQIQGAPGARSRDLIVLPQGATMTVAATAVLTPLVGNDGDTIDGNGATLTAAEDGKGEGLTISSSNFTLRGFQARGLLTAVKVDFGGRALTNITLEKLGLFGSSFMSALLVAGATKSNGSLRGLTIADSVFDTEREVVRANLVFVTAAHTPPNATVDNVLLENVRFVRNRVNGGGLGIYLTGSLGGGKTTNAVTRNAVLTDNVFTNQHDAAINLVGSLPAMGGQHVRVGMENVVATGNRVETANWGFYMGNEMYGATKLPGKMIDGFLRNVRVEKNTITKNAKGSRGLCIALENAADYAGDEATGNRIERIRIADNDISGCVQTARDGVPPQGLGAGIAVFAGRAALNAQNPGGSARNNLARDIEIANNRIRNSTRGIVLAGGFILNRGEVSNPTAATGNTMTEVRLLSNRLENNETGIRITGGDAPNGAVVTGNAISAVTIQGNQIIGARIACEAIANAGNATGNSVNAACPVAQR